MRLIVPTLVLLSLCLVTSFVSAQDTMVVPAAEPAASDDATLDGQEPAAAPVPEEASAPTPQANLSVASSAEDEPAPSRAPAAASAPDSDASSSQAGWMVLGIGGSMAAANIAIGLSMTAQGETNSEKIVGSATLAGGITGLAVSLLVGLLML